MKKLIMFLLMVPLLLSCSEKRRGKPGPHDLYFTSLATVWDEAIPIGNGITGALVWQKDGRLRISLDRADLWDLRPMENIGIPEWKFKWVYEQWKNKNYSEVQEKFDAPYDRLAGPTKIPAASIEFEISDLGEICGVWLDLQKALCRITWDSGIELDLFIEATGDCGWYSFSGTESPYAVLIPPSYEIPDVTNPAQVITHSLDRLGYEQGQVVTRENGAHFDQQVWGELSYSVDVSWIAKNSTVTGNWRITTSESKENTEDNHENNTFLSVVREDYMAALERHLKWWNNFWSASSVCLPDSVLERQWYLEMYKFGSVARSDSPPVSLQAVWTADNGQLPPWKGDFHHDLNTQLSYWPAYSSNHTDLSSGFTNWLWNNRETFRKYTKGYFDTDGLNVPGVSTLAGEPMGGWIQYSFGPTVSAWLAHHFYLQWIYTSDTTFLKERAYPWIKDVALHLEQLSERGPDGYRKFPISSSPEFNDNSQNAWFPEMTNFDRALTIWTFDKAAEMASALRLTEENGHFLKIRDEWPDLATDEKTGLMVAPGYPYSESHRHFSHLMAIYPLRLLDASASKKDSLMIAKSLENLNKTGTDYWTGYSFAWLGNLYACSGDGEGAAKALKVFAECFCLPNSFHVNGDQSGTGKSKFTYRPFTLEGNFAFAAGIQEMLLQSHRGMIEVFPAIPANWKDLSFSTLRARGSVLVSAEMKDGNVTEVKLFSEKGGIITLRDPFSGADFHSDKSYTLTDKDYQFMTIPGEEIVLKLKIR